MRSALTGGYILHVETCGDQAGSELMEVLQGDDRDLLDPLGLAVQPRFVFPNALKTTPLLVSPARLPLLIMHSMIH